jgi:hypothetical protein
VRAFKDHAAFRQVPEHETTSLPGQAYREECVCTGSPAASHGYRDLPPSQIAYFTFRREKLGAPNAQMQ